MENAALSSCQTACTATKPSEVVDNFSPTHLVGLDKEELKTIITDLGEASFRAKQLWHWIYVRGVSDIDAMNNISQSCKDKLKLHYSLKRPEIVERQISTDGTRKWLIRLSDGNEVETVYIPDVAANRGSLCISSQVGCTLTCSFCHTGTQTLVRNLTPAEIILQLMVARDDLEEWPSGQGDRLVSNIVMMGMGEPLFNYDNVVKALKIIMDGDGIALSKRRITLSTSGVVPAIVPLAHDLGVNLAISLHAVRNPLRNELVPLNKKYPIEVLLNACRDYAEIVRSRRITFEYVMLQGVNDHIDDAKALIELIQGIPAKINLIPFNPWPGSSYHCSDWSQIEAFGKIVEKAGYASPIRTPRGRDILAACGQLKSESLRLKRKSA